MSATTKIAWCDSTLNPWIGCTQVGPGCDNCYAREQDARRRWDHGKTHWGASVPRYRTSEANWKQPVTWNSKQASRLAGDPDTPPHRVFCASLADVFDNEVPDAWRADLFWLLMQTPYLEWLLVTKRIGNVAKMWPAIMHDPLPNVRLLITVCNQEEADRDIPKLLALPCKNGVSYEPALGPVDWSRWMPNTAARLHGTVDWIIVGGESGSKARPFNLEWARSTVAQCKAAGVPVFVKQLGSLPCQNCARCAGRGYHHGFGEGGADPDWCDKCGGPGQEWPEFKDRAGADPAEWSEDLRVREFPA